MPRKSKNVGTSLYPPSGSSMYPPSGSSLMKALADVAQKAGPYVKTGAELAPLLLAAAGQKKKGGCVPCPPIGSHGGDMYGSGKQAKVKVKAAQAKTKAKVPLKKKATKKPAPPSGVPSALKNPKRETFESLQTGNGYINEAKVQQKAKATTKTVHPVVCPETNFNKRVGVTGYRDNFRSMETLNRLSNLEKMINEDPTFMNGMDTSIQPRPSVASSYNTRGGENQYDPYQKIGGRKTGKGLTFVPGRPFP